jgi:uncharacterized SAM-binding protein YcdF (DUF218 family)
MRRIVDWLLRALGIVTLAAVVAGATGFLLMGHWLQLDEKPRKADYIVPLAGDYIRLMQAADLYKKGYAPTILLSDAAEWPKTRLDKLKFSMGWPRMGHLEFCRAVLKEMGTSTQNTDMFGDGHISTVEEAEALRAYLNGQDATLLVVTSPYHARRAQIILEDVLPNCEIIMTVTPEGSFPEKWWTDQRSAQDIVMEAAKLVHYWLGGAFRSDEAAAH